MAGEFDNLMFASMAMPKSININPLAQMQRLRAIRYMAGMGNMRIGMPTPRAATKVGYDPENPMASDPAMFQDPQFQAAANEALGQYGLQLPANVGNNSIFPNTGFFGRHPRLSGMLESGLYGLANTDTSGAETTADQISAGVRGAFAAHAARNQALMNPYMAPFAMAQQMENLRDLSDKHQLTQAQIGNYASLEKDRAARAQMGADKLEMSRPIPAEGGAWVPNPTTGRYEFQEGPGAKAARDASTQQERLITRKNAERKAAGKPPMSVDEEQQWLNRTVYGPRAAMAAGGRIGAGLEAGTTETIDEKQARMAQEREDKFLGDKKADFWVMRNIDPADTDSQRAWYRKNIASAPAPSPTPKNGKAAPTAPTAPQGKMNLKDLSKMNAFQRGAAAVVANPQRFAPTPTPRLAQQPTSGNSFIDRFNPFPDLADRIYGALGPQ